MIDISGEELLTFSQAAKTLPSRPHLSSLHRWRLSGVRGVKLETVLIGGRRFTSREALQRFAAATTAASSHSAAKATASRQREQEMESANREAEDLF